jgi:tetratricopeptide (TPR) repeat protein
VPNLGKADGITSIAKTNRFLKQADAYMKKKDFKAAIQNYESALKENPGLPAQAHLNLGAAYYQIQDYAKSQKSYLNASSLTVNPALKSQALLQLGNIFFQKKDYKSSLEWYKRSLKTSPENEMARFNYELAYKLFRQQQEQEKKSNPQQDKNQDSQKDKAEGQKNKQDKGDSKEQNQNKGQENNEGQDQNSKGPVAEKTSDKKGEDKNQNSKLGSRDQKGNDGQEAEEVNQSENSKKGKNAEELEDKNGKEQSKNKGAESAEAGEENARRVDPNKLKEIGLTEDQAKALLQAMRQSEVKYLQQRRFKSRIGGSDSDKPKW